MDLIAVWGKKQDVCYDLPQEIRWANGTLATMADYYEHICDTQCWIENGLYGRELHMFPNVVAIVRFDLYGRVWGASGNGVETVGLPVSDPFATDDEILAALNVGRFTYRANIIR